MDFIELYYKDDVTYQYIVYTQLLIQKYLKNSFLTDSMWQPAFPGGTGLWNSSEQYTWHVDIDRPTYVHTHPDNPGVLHHPCPTHAV